MDKYGRTWRDNPKRALIYSAAMAAATTVYWYMRKDDDDYKEQPAWLKWGFWTYTDDVGKPIVRIPRPFEWGWTVSAGTEAILNSLYEENPEEVGKWATEAITSMLPGFDPVLLGPTAETYFDYDMFRKRPIVGEYGKGVKPEDQSKPYTTGTSKMIGKAVKFSPARIEHLLDGLTGSLYGRLARAAEGEPGELLGKKAFTLRKDYTKSINEFYEAREAATQERGSAKRKGDAPAAVEAAYRKANFYADTMGKVRDLLGDTKERDKRFEYEKYLTGLARAGLGREELDRYPNLLTAKNLPPKLGKIRNERLDSQILAFTAPYTGKKDRAASVPAAGEVLGSLGTNYGQARMMLDEAWIRKNWKLGSGKYYERVNQLQLRWGKVVQSSPQP
jgi:hypothetical protein